MKKLKRLSLNKENVAMLEDLDMFQLRGGRKVKTKEWIDADGEKSCLLDEAISKGTTRPPIGGITTPAPSVM